MMPDPHNESLSVFYNYVTQQAHDYVAGRFTLQDLDDGDKEVAELKLPSSGKPYKFWKVDVAGETETYGLIVAIPWCFPDAFPRIYLSSSDYERLKPLPHVDRNRFVCTRDPRVCVLNDRIPGEAVEYLLKVAVATIDAGRSGKNRDDFKEEFLAYWNDDADCLVLSLFDPLDSPTQLTVAELDTQLFGSRQIITDDVRSAHEWLRPFGASLKPGGNEPALYLPLDAAPEPTLRTNREVLDLLSGLSESHQQVIRQFRGLVIVASFPHRDDRVLFAWVHKRTKTRGFRNASPTPLRLRLGSSRDETIIKLHLHRMDADRLHRRTAGMEPDSRRSYHVALLGCGSLGSHLALDLAKSGVDRITLVDYETLKAENVPRHLCTMVEAAKAPNKAHVLRDRLQQHCPHLQCDAHDTDVLNLLKSGALELDSFSMIVCALGNLAVERRVDQLMGRGQVSCGVAYTWIEPFGVGGHVLYVAPKGHDVFQRCFDETGHFRHSLVNNPEQFVRREAGCQVSFLPYGHLDLRMFATMAARVILKSLRENTKSTLWTWVGDTASLEEKGYKLRPDFEACPPYTLLRKDL